MSAKQAIRAFNSDSLHVQMHGRALRYRPFTWRMTRGKQPRRVKIYSRVNRPHVIDYGVEPPVVRDARFQSIVDNWEPKV